jgi:hypothetical protein
MQNATVNLYQQDGDEDDDDDDDTGTYLTFNLEKVRSLQRKLFVGRFLHQN